MRQLSRLALLIGLIWLAAAPAASASPFSDWSWVVVAGDWHAHSGGPSEAFDNARRDVTQAFERAGFDPANLRQFSVRPELYKGAGARPSPTPQAIGQRARRPDRQGPGRLPDLFQLPRGAPGRGG